MGAPENIPEPADWDKVLERSEAIDRLGGRASYLDGLQYALGKRGDKTKSEVVASRYSKAKKLVNNELDKLLEAKKTKPSTHAQWGAEESQLGMLNQQALFARIEAETPQQRIAAKTAAKHVKAKIAEIQAMREAGATLPEELSKHILDHARDLSDELKGAFKKGASPTEVSSIMEKAGFMPSQKQPSSAPITNPAVKAVVAGEGAIAKAEHTAECTAKEVVNKVSKMSKGRLTAIVAGVGIAGAAAYALFHNRENQARWVQAMDDRTSDQPALQR